MPHIDTRRVPLADRRLLGYRSDSGRPLHRPAETLLGSLAEMRKGVAEQCAFRQVVGVNRG